MKKEIRKRSFKNKLWDIGMLILMLLSGIGILYMLFAKQEAVAMKGQLLAPPFPDYLVYILPLIFIAGAIYFLWKRAKRDIIPLSFQ